MFGGPVSRLGLRTLPFVGVSLLVGSSFASARRVAALKHDVCSLPTTRLLETCPPVTAARGKVIHSDSSIIWNLAYEHYILENVRPKSPLLFMWRNGKTIVIGRNQNPWKECDLQKMEEDGVLLARRLSGGGAVYQDNGNTVFSFISPVEAFNATRNNNIILRALHKRYGIVGEASGRNDLLVNGRKFSGAAFKLRNGVWVHHGTVMRNVDMDGLQRYLTPNKLKLQSKGVSSVAARVLNLSTINDQITHEGLVAAIAEEYLGEYGMVDGEVEFVGEGIPFEGGDEFEKHYANLKDWNWRFGSTPQFSDFLETRFDWGTVTLHLDVHAAIVTAAVVFSDSLQVDLKSFIETAILGCRYGGAELSQALRRAAATTAASDDLRFQIHAIAEWAAREIEL